MSTVSHTSGQSGKEGEEEGGEANEVVFLGDNKPVIVHRKKNNSVSSGGGGKGEGWTRLFVLLCLCIHFVISCLFRSVS